ncbi:MAG: hypothetical protein ACK4N1_08285, partial [Pseudorhizobium sp.]
MFWQSIIEAFIGTVAGGLVASLTAYKLTRRAGTIESTYQVVHHILSDEMSAKRRKARYGLTEYTPDQIAKSSKPTDGAT